MHLFLKMTFFFTFVIVIISKFSFSDFTIQMIFLFDFLLLFYSFKKVFLSYKSWGKNNTKQFFIDRLQGVSVVFVRFLKIFCLIYLMYGIKLRRS